MNRAEKLTQANSAKSFWAQPVPTDGELAGREGRHYEPASALLEAIRAQRGTFKQGKDARRGRRTS